MLFQLAAACVAPDYSPSVVRSAESAIGVLLGAPAPLGKWATVAPISNNSNHAIQLFLVRSETAELTLLCFSFLFRFWTAVLIRLEHEFRHFRRDRPVVND